MERATEREDEEAGPKEARLGKKAKSEMMTETTFMPRDRGGDPWQKRSPRKER